MAIAPALLEAGLTVDRPLGRLPAHGRSRRTSAGTACRTPRAELLAQAVYGLPELARAALAGRAARRVPRLLPDRDAPGGRARRSRRAPPRATASSSTRSPASRERAARPSAATHFVIGERGGRAVQGRLAPPHARDRPAARASRRARPSRVTFTPHLVPMTRGLLSTVYLEMAAPASPPTTLVALYAERYAGEPFVTVHPAGRMPSTAEVRGTQPGAHRRRGRRGGGHDRRRRARSTTSSRARPDRPCSARTSRWASPRRPGSTCPGRWCEGDGRATIRRSHSAEGGVTAPRRASRLGRVRGPQEVRQAATSRSSRPSEPVPPRPSFTTNSVAAAPVRRDARARRRRAPAARSSSTPATRTRARARRGSRTRARWPTPPPTRSAARPPTSSSPRPASSASRCRWTWCSPASPTPPDALDADGGDAAAAAIMTTDTFPKQTRRRSCEVGGRALHGRRHGQGLGHDPAEHGHDARLRHHRRAADAPRRATPRSTSAVGRTFNRITVDTDTSTNDMCLLMASGAAGGDVDRSGRDAAFAPVAAADRARCAASSPA